MTAQTIETVDPNYLFWLGALAGNPPELTRGRAESGFYRNRNRDGVYEPIAIWRDAKGLCVKIGEKPFRPRDEEEFCERTFAWCAKHPVTQEAYDFRMANGRWPDDAPPPAVDKSNLPEDPFEALKVEIEAELQELQDALKNRITDAEAATRFGNWKIRFEEAWKRGEAMRKAEKKPHDDAAKAVQTKFLPVLDLADKGKQLITRALNEFTAAERKRQQEEQSKAAEALKTAGLNPEQHLAPVPEKTSVATVGRKLTEVTTWSAEIEDYAKALEALKDHPDVRAAVESIANAAARSKARLPIPGVKYVPNTSFR